MFKFYKLNALLKLGLTFGCFVVFALASYGSNVSISNVNLTGQNKASSYTLVQFDISWDNSWRTSSLESNWDACWVFVKFRYKNKDKWHHATLNHVNGTGVDDGHTVPSGAQIDSEDDTQSGGSHGVFIHADADMSQQNVSYNGVELRWNYGTDGVADNDRVEVSVHAIEMVYIPKGSFEIGDGNGSNESNDAFHTTTNSTSSVTIDNSLTSDITSNMPTTPTYADDLPIGIDGDGGLDKDNDNNIENADFPTGYEAFYVMKYELSMGQYTEFLNKLASNNNASNRDNTSNNGSYGFTISSSGGTFSTSTPDRACNFIGWADATAYADWAALRPMTETEFEKACRGGVSAVYDEFAWGNTNINTGTTYSLNNKGSNNEEVSNPQTNTGNAQISSNSPNFEPFRNGIFAASATNKTREETGATIYGVMEMSGNLYETVVTPGNDKGQSFKDVGDGSLNGSGQSDESNWPGYSSGNISDQGPDGIIFRGGAFSDLTSRANISARVIDPKAYGGGGREHDLGFRCARSAP